MIMYKNSPIAVIDSGIGGLTLLKELHKKYPNENYIYLADNRCMPYGNKSARFIKHRLLELVNYLYDNFNVKLVILGCNTASISALEYLQKHSPVEVWGLNLLDLIKCNTIKYDKFADNCNDSSFVQKDYATFTKAGEDLNCHNKECDLNTTKLIQNDYIVLCTKLSSKGYKSLNTYNCKNLAQYIEDNYFDKVAIRRKIKNTMLKVSQNNIVLGCTHYELMADEFQNLNNSKNFILPCYEFVKSLQLNSLNPNPKAGDILMISTLPTKSYIDKLWKIFKV